MEAHTTHAAQNVLGADAVMWCAHGVAALMTTWLIVAGERSLLTIAAWLLLVPVTVVLAAVPGRFARPKAVLPVGTIWLPHPMNIAQTLWTRGPPVPA